MDDADRFAAFYEQESEAVLVFLTRRTMDAEVALDLTAETFALALCSWRKLAGMAPEQARAWLFTVARRRWAQFARSARVQRRAVVRLGIRVPVVHHEDLALIEERSGLAQLRASVAGELERLGAQQRRALQLRIVEERSYEEVARELGISQQTARARVSRALRKLAAAVVERQPRASEPAP